jgi:UDP-N-acetylglucosamine 2-epimerase (non-hydrolysing)/GDP/UDP-N,N'-diacetylbacillosamine 2-epimerase (hydrolysing)|tara:strand:+ start:1537 stop:2673 length:1137 start_codon:yes stop_codon:yes gene_type:complete
MHEHEGLDPRLIVAASHLEKRFGSTVEAIRSDGFEPDALIPCLAEGDTPESMARTLADLSSGLVDVLESIRPDLILLIADRYEMMAPASIATAMGIPIVHVEGGEISEGALDQQVRDALTKLSHVHLVPHQAAAERVRSLGEDADRVHVVGAPSLDHLRWSQLPSIDDVRAHVGVDAASPPLLVSMHPVTLQEDPVADAVELVAALDRVDRPVVFCFPNADAGHDRIIDLAEAFCRRRRNASLHRHIDHLQYWTLLAHAGALVGNSSSGIMESPALSIPCVNIGDRQRGRLRAANIIDSAPDADRIHEAIVRALEPSFASTIAGLANPYGDGDAGRRIADILAGCPSGQSLLRKRIASTAAGSGATAASFSSETETSP